MSTALRLDQDLTTKREALAALGVNSKRIYVDHGLTGTNRDRPGLGQALGRRQQQRHARRDQARPSRPVRSGRGLPADLASIALDEARAPSRLKSRLNLLRTGATEGFGLNTELCSLPAQMGRGGGI